METKYLVSRAAFVALAERLGESHAVLEVGGTRAFAYRTTYFDTPELRTYRDHLQGRRRRFKCRTRDYRDSDSCSFEVKLKGPRGRTVKHRMAYASELREEVSPMALAYLGEALRRSYGAVLGEELAPTLELAYSRVTLVGRSLDERLTCDFDLGFVAPDGAGGRLVEDSLIVETKSARGVTDVDRILWSLGARPVRGCSKYCLGVGFTRPELKANRFRPLLRRYFEEAVPEPSSVAA